MKNTDPRVDAYIDNANDFATPILKHLRRLVHEVCPEVQEGIKWGFPAFDYKGYLCGMTAHKAHCSFTLWKGSLMEDPQGHLEIVGKTGMGHFGKIKTPGDLPDDGVLKGFIMQGMRLNKEGTTVTRQPVKSSAVDIPGYFMERLRTSKKALETFEAFSNYNKKEYVEWVTGAKTEATRERRMSQAVEWMAEGKVRNWKYL